MPDGDKLLPVQVWSDRVEFARPLDDPILLRVNLGFDEEHPDATVKEEGAKEVEDPIDQGNEGDPDPDHETAHDQRAEDTPVQDPVLVFAGDGEIAKDESDDKDIVHRKGQLDQIASDELKGFLVSPEGFQGQGKEHRQGEPDGTPGERFPESDNMGATMEDAQVERQQHYNAANKTNPVPAGDLHHRGGGYLRTGTATVSTGACTPAPMWGRWPLCHQRTSALAM